MGLFNKMFSGKNEENQPKRAKIQWIPLASIGQLDEIAAASTGKTQVIFKHSTTCGISRMVLNMFTSSYALEVGKVDMYFLDLLANRDVSNAVAEKFQVMHQSPQMLIIKNGVVVAHDSHGAINELLLDNYV
ncbi:bacillithiol system redox-active protein YtxJ [Maribacter chungangensis]|uniref:Bacillithiol system redox-active protein YtxJ n=1 Tax=Maribacter chungangensis TaxID=1069117 RepID=A0ABW3B3S0_9FLAO